VQTAHQMIEVCLGPDSRERRLTVVRSVSDNPDSIY
jgi:hypothetical protein